MSAPERIWAKLDRATVYMDGSSPLVARTREFDEATEYVRADLYATLEAQLADRARVAELLRVIEHEATKQPSGPVGALETDEVLWCETCGERPQEVRTEHAGLCRECWVSEGRPE